MPDFIWEAGFVPVSLIHVRQEVLQYMLSSSDGMCLMLSLPLLGYYPAPSYFDVQTHPIAGDPFWLISRFFGCFCSVNDGDILAHVSSPCLILEQTVPPKGCEQGVMFEIQVWGVRVLVTQ